MFRSNKLTTGVHKDSIYQLWYYICENKAKKKKKKNICRRLASCQLEKAMTSFQNRETMISIVVRQTFMINKAKLKLKLTQNITYKGWFRFNTERATKFMKLANLGLMKGQETVRRCISNFVVQWHRI